MIFNVNLTIDVDPDEFFKEFDEDVSYLDIENMMKFHPDWFEIDDYKRDYDPRDCEFEERVAREMELEFRRMEQEYYGSLI